MKDLDNPADATTLRKRKMHIPNELEKHILVFLANGKSVFSVKIATSLTNILGKKVLTCVFVLNSPSIAQQLIVLAHAWRRL
jgi:hypothetical protein